MSSPGCEWVEGNGLQKCKQNKYPYKPLITVQQLKAATTVSQTFIEIV